MSMPGPGGTQHVIHVNLRSANYESNLLRTAGKVVYAQLRGKDVAGVTQYDPMHPDEMDSLNSFGNTETIPPHSFNGEDYPLGRVLRGSNPQFYPDESFDRMVTAQGVQPTLFIDTEWLWVGHVDETLSFIKANTPRGWAMLLNDATLAKKMLQDAADAGYGDIPMFVGMKWWNLSSAQATISEVLNDPEVMNSSAWAATEVDAQLTQLETATGITEADIVKIPFLHTSEMGYSIAYNPGTVNGIYLSDKDFGAPDPHGPIIDGQDIFKKQLEEALAPFGVKVHWIENWNLYHALNGEVHCGSNVTRAIPTETAWWESGR
jgi:protein-arginine deiminase